MKVGISVKLLALAALAASVLAQPNTSQPAADTTPLAKEIRHELLMMPYYGVFDNLSFRIDGDQVTLMGEVSRPTLKTEAERRVKAITGVEIVDNQIRILPLSPYDNRLRIASARTIFGNPALSRYSWGAHPPIHLIVENGTLTLKGVVDSKADRDLAGILANGIPGAFAVNNELVIN